MASIFLLSGDCGDSSIVSDGYPKNPSLTTKSDKRRQCKQPSSLVLCAPTEGQQSASHTTFENHVLAMVYLPKHLTDFVTHTKSPNDALQQVSYSYSLATSDPACCQHIQIR